MLPKKVVFLASGNVHKYQEAKRIFAEEKLSLILLRVKPIEIQSDSLEEIASHCARIAAEEWNLPIIVEDSGLFIEALNGFPGPYSSYVFKKIGCKGILKLMEGFENRKAFFRSVISYCEGRKCEPICFVGEVHGFISRKERGHGGFGFDPIFIPVEGDGRTFAEMSIEEKNIYSHRARAVRSFVEWFEKRLSEFT